MGIQSTQTVSRRWAIERIKEINDLVSQYDFKRIKEVSFEPDCDVVEFIRKFQEIDFIEHIDNWTDTMLEDVLDKPFFRRSMFDNYTVVFEVNND